jgi:hypothetical protein
MKKPEWPGIATAAALICAGTIIVAIGRDSDFKLKDWQTFMAACVALVGGTMAYRGAMAKVNLDRDLAEFQRRRVRLALFLKVEMALTLLEGEVMRQRKWADVSPTLVGMRKISVPDFKFNHPPELDQAWDNLDLFADETVTTLANIRSTLRTIDDNNRLWGDDISWVYDWLHLPDEIKRLIIVLKDLESFCLKAVREIRRETADRQRY